MISRPCNLSCWQLGFTLFMISALISNVDADSIELNSSPTQYYVEDIKAAMDEHVAAVVDDSDIFHIRDDVTNEDLTLKFIQVHDPVREIDGEIYFACTDFHAVGDTKKIYDVDFWLRETDGELKVFRTKIHKEPRKSILYGWYKHPRYTFVNDKIEYLYSE